MKKKISRKDKQTIQLVSIKEGLERWSNLYENCVHKNLFHDKKWLSLYINSKDFYLCFISKGGLDIAAMPLSKERPFRMKIGGPIIRNTVQKMKLSKSIAYQKSIFENFAEFHDLHSNSRFFTKIPNSLTNNREIRTNVKNMKS